MYALSKKRNGEIQHNSIVTQVTILHSHQVGVFVVQIYCIEKQTTTYCNLINVNNFQTEIGLVGEKEMLERKKASNIMKLKKEDEIGKEEIKRKQVINMISCLMIQV